MGKSETDRAETCEFLEDKLHEVEAELKELREESCWIFLSVSMQLDLFFVVVGVADCSVTGG